MSWSMYITERGGGKRILNVFDYASTIHAEIGLNDAGTAEIEFSGCGELVKDLGLECYAHEIHINYEGKEWFVGPLWDITIENQDTTSCIFRNSMGWLQLRKVHNLLDYTTTGAGQINAVEFAKLVIIDAMTPDDPLDLLGNLVVYNSGTDVSDRKADPTIGNMSWEDVLAPMLTSSIDLTCIGRKVVLSVAGTCIGRLADTVTRSDFIDAPLLNQAGANWASSWVVTGTQGSDQTSTTPTVGSAGGFSPRYGLVERKSQDKTVGTNLGAQEAAQRLLAQSQPKPSWTVGGSEDSAFKGSIKCTSNLNPLTAYPGVCLRLDFAPAYDDAAHIKRAILDIEEGNTAFSLEIGTDRGIIEEA